MDKLKENAYWISLGAIVLVLLLLAWFLVVDRIFFGGPNDDTVAALGARLEKSLKSIEEYTRREHVPTEEYETHLMAALERVRQDHNDGAVVYNDAQERFNEYFPGMDDPPDPGLFASTYHEKTEDLLKAYRKKFGIETQAPAEDSRDRDKEEVEVPAVDRLDQAEIFRENVPIAMKEYWIAEAIFEALTELEIGGLQKIDFLGRRKEAEDENEHFGTIEVAVKVEMPFSMIEDLITQLFADDRVLFTFDGLLVTKTVEHLKPFMTLKKVADFESRDDADRARYADVVTEPNVTVDLSFSVLDWKGHKIIERGDLEDGDEEEDEDFEEDEELEEDEEDDGVVRRR